MKTLEMTYMMLLKDIKIPMTSVVSLVTQNQNQNQKKNLPSEAQRHRTL